MASLGKLAVAFLAAGHATAADDDRLQRAFNEFKAEYRRTYFDLEEEQARFEIFKNNFARIETQNAKDAPYKLAINEFADQSSEEFAAGRLGLSIPAPGKLWAGLPFLGTHKYSGAVLETSVDWTQKGAVTPPKNQAQCGSCWAFSATGAIEGAVEIAKGKLVSLSEQELVDCARDESQGCHGGAMDNGFQYAVANGLCTEESYPYEAKDGKCRASNCTVGLPKGSVVGFKDVTPDDEQALMEAVGKQPVSVAIEADEIAFQLYSKGVLIKKCGTKLDHGVLLVGYGTDNGVDYWKLKNSWGAAWGEHGYLRIERGGSSKEGECGIKMDPSYPVVAAAQEVATIVV